MEQQTEEPRKITPTEARAKLLRSLVTPHKNLKQPDRERLEEAQVNFIRSMLNDHLSGE